MVSAPNREIANVHLVNIVVFAFSFLCFEFLLRTIVANGASDPDADGHFSAWPVRIIGYSLFLWASIYSITLELIQPDMLMSGFLYLASGLLIRIRFRRATWGDFLLLGFVLGVGYLAKAPMLPIGIIILACTIATRHWRETILKAAVAAAILLLVGSLYFVPLSKQVGRLTFGESSEYNVLFHIDHIGIYSETLGSAAGQFRNSPELAVQHPPVYRFSTGERVTYPLKFDPARWTIGAKPRLDFSSELSTISENAAVYRSMLPALAGVFAGILVLGAMSNSPVGGVRANWPLAAIGVSGLAMYLLVHVEERYAGAFVLLLGLGLIAGVCEAPKVTGRVSRMIAVAIALSLVLPVTAKVRADFLRNRNRRNEAWEEAARELTLHGIRAGDPVARICPRLADLNWARAMRATIVAEVQFDRVNEYWSSSPEVQNRVLRALAATGAKVVVANLPDGGKPPEGWQPLGGGPYWFEDLAPFRLQ